MNDGVCPRCNIDDLIETYGNLGYYVKDRKVYPIINPDFDNPAYEIIETDLEGKIKYKGEVVL
jgi:hypothetical protein